MARCRLVPMVMLLAVVASSCSSSTAVTTTTTSTSTPIEPDTPAPTTTSTTSPFEPVTVAVADDTDAEITTLLGDLYTWLTDRDAPQPGLPDGLLRHIGATRATFDGIPNATVHTAPVRDLGLAGVAIVEESDVVLLVNDDHPRGGHVGWRIVGGWFANQGLDPWFGDPIRRVMTIGTDAREWQDPIRFRGDSLHIVTSNTETGGGGILGFPRDSWIEAPYGMDKFTHVNATTWLESDDQVETALAGLATDPYLGNVARWLGLDAVDELLREGPDGGETTVAVAEALTGLEIEGYILTGFRDFQLLLNDYGSVVIDVPFAMADAASQAYFDAGPQEMWGRYALAFSRNRHLRGGDFTRSLHQGMVILARLDRVLDGDFTQLPHLVAALAKHTWTNLTLEQLVTLGAGAYLLDPSEVGNAVVPGSVATRGGASVVLLSERAEDYYRDLDDGVLDLDYVTEDE